MAQQNSKTHYMEVSGRIGAVLAQKKDRTVWSIAPEATVFEAIELMAQKKTAGRCPWWTTAVLSESFPNAITCGK